MDSKTRLSGIIIGCLIGVAMGLLILEGFKLYQKRALEIRKDKQTVAWVHNFLRQKQGWNKEIGSYHLASFDCGRTWYNVKTTDDEPVGDSKIGYTAQHGFSILGTADPKVLANIQAWDALTDFAFKKGTIDPSTLEGRKLLTDAGFEIKEVK